MAIPTKDIPPPPEPAAGSDQLEALYQRLEERVRQSRPNEDLEPLRRAYEFALHLHAGQTRDSGEPYMAHPLEVTIILAGMMMDQVTLIAGILHDVVEDTPVKNDEIKKRFGEDVARIVDGVTKLSKIQFYSREDRQAENVRKMLLAMVSDVRVIIVKLADRIHNCRTLDGIKDPERRKRIAQETMEIYAPIANRLGMGKVRGELEDLSFRHLDPEAFTQVIHEIETTRQASEGFLVNVKQIVESKLKENGIPARVEARMKRPYSVYVKLQKQRIGIDQVYDLLAMRIITDSVKNCYAALGVIHNEWHPIPGRIKDFIAIPRPNLYQSLHTSVMGPDGQPFEVQFRTEEMHRVAEEGIAAHWKYKEGKRGQAGDERVNWMRQLVEWQKEMRDPTDFMSTLKRDLNTEEVYCFTPGGKVIMLAQGGCPVDFAYAVHSDIGHLCVGAKVNGRIVPLKYELKNGDVVEILTQAGHSPSKDWLSFVKSSKARNRIRHFINATERVKAIEIGQKYLEKEARRLGVALSKVSKEQLESVAGEYGYPKIEDLHAALGYGKNSARQVLHRLAPETVTETEPEKPEPEKPSKFNAESDQDLVLSVDGMNDLMINLARCCNPIKGEPIVGYISRGKGVTVHAKSCKNVENLMYEAERRINVDWTRTTGRSFRVRMTVYSDDRLGMLNQITSILFAENSNIQSLETRDDTDRGEGKIIDVTTDVRDKKQLEKITATLRRVSGVRHVDRVQ
ncbi:MAG: bifunctional (p)ppGpp synthetase/guanosine-3',5'-bis(diphosphate) 3'-pyrophosphohydrolase [Bryobacteraceae bacterium]|nr:bifunctional (p)ppGpp synthetase/guanosine-3',5'-bis(diphosphate) 3'-pyrophosphohydrolase [Bryobacteraceae bacterium]